MKYCAVAERNRFVPSKGFTIFELFLLVQNCKLVWVTESEMLRGKYLLSGTHLGFWHQFPDRRTFYLLPLQPGFHCQNILYDIAYDHESLVHAISQLSSLHQYTLSCSSTPLHTNLSQKFKNTGECVFLRSGFHELFTVTLKAF